LGLENLTLEEERVFQDSAINLQDAHLNPGKVGEKVARHAFENNEFKKLRGKIKDKDAREELEDLVMKYSKGMAVDSNYFKKAHSQYNVGKLGKIIGTGAVASGLMYALPGRFYPSVNGVGDALKYLLPFTGKSIAKDLGKYALLRSIKGIGSTFFSPLMYLSAGYSLYKLVKGLIHKKKNKNERSKLVKSLSNEDLYQTLEGLKRMKGVEKDYSFLKPGEKNEAAA